VAREDEQVYLLRETVALLRIIARPQLIEMKERFRSAMLSSSKRQHMWSEMDGTRSLSDIGKKVGVTSEAVRSFVSDIEDKWPEFIEARRVGNAIWPRRTLLWG